MKPQCIEAVGKAAGRKLTAAEVDALQAKIVKAMRLLAAADPGGFRRMTPEQRLQAAAKSAADAVTREHNLKAYQLEQEVKASARLDSYIREQKARGMDELEALQRFIANRPDGKSNVISVESHAAAIKADLLRQVVGAFEAVDPRFFGFLENPEGVRTLTRELFGEDTGNAQAKQAAADFHRVANDARERFNRAGGIVPFLQTWAIPQHHAQRLVAAAGRDAWIRDVLPLLRRERYLTDSGARMTDDELLRFLADVYETIATGGVNNMVPGSNGAKMKANARDLSREVHFKDADAYIAYQAKYGEKSLLAVVNWHLAGIARDVALVERLGPNPDHLFRVYRDRGVQAIAKTDPRDTGSAQARAAKLDSLYGYVAGRFAPVVNWRLAEAFDTLRNFLVASRLGSATVSAIPDQATIEITARVNQLPEIQLVANQIAALNPADKVERRLANRAGLALDAMLSEANRWGADQLGPGWSSRMSNTVIRLSGLEALDAARRRGFGVTMFSALGQLTKDHAKLGALDPGDYRILLSKGLTETDWAVWKAAALEDWGRGPGSDTMLTPEAVARIPDEKLAALGARESTSPQALREQATTKLLAAVLEEVDMAVIRPGAREKVAMGATLDRGSWKGELARSFFLFKAFPMTMISRHWMRGANMETAGGKAAYIASLVAGTTVLGALSMQIEQLLAGKDPRNIADPGKPGFARNWMAAFMKGGSLGIYGDFLFSTETQHGGGVLSTVQGPVFSLADEAFNLTQGNAIQMIQGRDTNAAAEMVKLIKGITPGANLWYTKAATDHLLFQALQEYLSPGYGARVRARAEREFGDRYYWQPGTAAPQRAPDLARVGG